MKNFTIGLLTTILITTAWAGFKDTGLSPQAALNVLAKVGRKAWYAFNTNSQELSRVTKFGFNKDVDTLGPEILASFGGGVVQVGLSAETLTIVSTSALDDVGSTGATNILVTCIDSDGLEVLVPVVMDGLTPVVTTQTCKFVNRAIVLTAGSSRKNSGDISIIQTSSGVQLAEIPLLKSVTQQLIFYVPSNQICYLDRLDFHARKLGGGAAPRVEYDVEIYSQTQDVIYTIREYFVDLDINDTIEELDFKAEPLRPNEIFITEIITDTNDTVVTGHMEITCLIK